MDETPNLLSEAEKLAAALAALEAERGRRRKAKWLAGELTIPVRIVDEGETVDDIKLKPWGRDYPPDEIVIHIIKPKPAVELPGEQFEQPDTQDVSPPPYRPPPSPPPSSARSLPPPRGQPDPRNYNIPGDVAAAERRRTRNFNDDTWGDPTGWPIRYPRGNRSGW